MIEGHARALSSPTPREKQRLAGGSPRVFAGWLFVEANNKRAFAWRFCVLDGLRFQVYATEIKLHDLDTPAAKEALVRQHVLVHVERMHQLNRGMLLVGQDGYGLWIHGTHDESHFEQWLAILHEAVQSQSVRLTISRYGFVHQSSSEFVRDSGVAYTGWLNIRRCFVRGWVLGPVRRMYCVLSGRHLSAFKINIEGRWADLHGTIEQLSLAKNTKWLELVLSTGVVLRISAKSEDVTSMWELRIEAALRREPLSAPTRSAPVLSTLAPRRLLTY
jgi:hypothetical protein